MKISQLGFVKGIGWTVGGYGATQIIRLVTIVTMARLLAPELFGIMTIVNSLRTTIDLVSDLGITQNIIQNKNSDDPNFYNTAWSLQIIRGPLLWAVCLALAAPLANLYENQILILVLPVAALYFIFSSFTSVSGFLLQRRLRLLRLNVFEVLIEFISGIANVVLAYINPSIWALVLGGLVYPATRMIGSYLLLPNLRQKFYISKQYALEIFSFGKWIFLSSIVYVLSMNFDRLYLGKAAPLGVLGVYGIARSLSEPMGALILRLCSFVVFPVIASSSNMPRDQLHTQLAPLRLRLLLAAAFGLSLMATAADWLVAILYDQRYHAAGWMLPILIIGVWFSIICSVNESTLMGFGKPLYGTIGNSLKFGYMLIGLPLGYLNYGIFGAVVVMAMSDLWRYLPVLFGLARERCSFGVQDWLVTIVMFILIGLFEWLRWTFGLGISLGSLPIGGLI